MKLPCELVEIRQNYRPLRRDLDVRIIVWQDQSPRFCYSPKWFIALSRLAFVFILWLHRLFGFTYWSSQVWQSINLISFNQSIGLLLGLPIKFTLKVSHRGQKAFVCWPQVLGFGSRVSDRINRSKAWSGENQLHWEQYFCSSLRTRKLPSGSSVKGFSIASRNTSRRMNRIWLSHSPWRLATRLESYSFESSR